MKDYWDKKKLTKKQEKITSFYSTKSSKLTIESKSNEISMNTLNDYIDCSIDKNKINKNDYNHFYEHNEFNSLIPITKSNDFYNFDLDSNHYFNFQSTVIPCLVSIAFHYSVEVCKLFICTYFF